MELIFDLGIEVTLLAQSIGDWALPFMLFLSYLGNAGFYLVVILIILWCFDTNLGLRIGLLLMISVCLNTALKAAFHSPRPYWTDSRVSAFAAETNFGNPSGHSQNAVIFWGMISYHFKKVWLWIPSIIIIFLIGFSRIYLGVHYLHDVLIGWLIGAILLTAYILFEAPITRWIRRASSFHLVLGAIIASWLLLIPSILAEIRLNEWHLPQEWIEMAAQNAIGSEIITPTSFFEEAVIGSGVFLGLAIGAIHMQAHGNFKVGGKFIKRFIRLIVGVFGLALIFLGIQFFSPTGDGLVTYIYLYFGYALIGFWITGLAPRLFIMFNLASST